MVSTRTVSALVGLAAGLLVSLAAWVYLETLLLFVFLPFVPFLFLGRGESARTEPERRHCPRCDFETATPEYEYCPRDGSRLRQGASDQSGRI